MEYFIKTSVLIALFYISYKVFLQRETFFNANRWFLMLGFLTSLLLPLIVLSNYIYVEPATLEQNFYIYETVASQPIETSFDLMKWVIFTYYAGTIFFFIKWLINFSSLIVLLKNNRIQKIGSYYMITTDKQTAPFSFFKWIAYNPAQFTTDELQLIINHEKVHAREWHSIDIIISQLLSIIFWFNPIIWLYKKEMQQNLEFIADQKAQKTSSCHKHYQKLLLKTSLPHQQLAITNNFYNSLIKKRIVMLHKSKSNILNSWKYALILPALVIFMMSFNTKDVFIEKPMTSASDNLIENHQSSDKKTIPNTDLVITKDMTDVDLETLKNDLKEKGFEAHFKNIKRNSQGEITSIKIDISSKNSNANYHINGDKGILPITIDINEDEQTISLISGTSKADKHAIYIENNDEDDVDKPVKNVVYLNGKGKVTDTVHIEKDVKKLVLTSGSGKKTNIITSGNGNKAAYTVSTNGDEPLVILNGKIVTENDVEVHSSIETATTLKGKNATYKYNDDGKHSVVEINTNSSSNNKAYTIDEVTYIGDTDTSKNAKMFYLSKETKDSEFDLHKAKLKILGIDANYSKIKRDNTGKIVSIKIRLNNNDGQKASATYENSNGIGNIRYGIVGDELVIQSVK